MIKLPDPNSPSELLSKVQEAAAELEKAKQALQGELRTALHASLKVFFEVHPSAVQIRWRQYTPYFNDGEPCEFSVHEPELLLARHVQEIENGERWVEGYSAWSIGYALRQGRPIGEEGDDVSEAMVKDFLAISEAIMSDEDAMRAIFGDHAEVIATKDGITVEEYDHD